MMFDRDYQLKLLNDVLNQRFSDADDLVNFVQNRTGKKSIAVSSLHIG